MLLKFTIGIALGGSAQSTGAKLLQSLADPFETHREAYVRQWQRAAVKRESDFSEHTSDDGQSFIIMDPVSISALCVLGGSLGGALTSLVSTWLTQQHLDRRELLGKQIADRETLYANFISEAARALVDSLDHNLHNMGGLIPLYTLFGRIRLSSSNSVMTAGEKVITEILAGYSRPNLTAAQFQEIMASLNNHERADPLAEFSLVCREELRAMAVGGFARARKGPSPKKKTPQPSR